MEMKNVLRIIFYIASILWGILAILQFLSGDIDNAKISIMIGLLFGIQSSLMDRGKS